MPEVGAAVKLKVYLGEWRFSFIAGIGRLRRKRNVDARALGARKNGISVFHPLYAPRWIISLPDFSLIKYLPLPVTPPMGDTCLINVTKTDEDHLDISAP